MNIELLVSFQDSDFNSSAKIPEVGLLDHMVVLFIIFCKTSILFSIVIMSFFILNNNYLQGFQFSHIFANTYCLLIF